MAKSFSAIVESMKSFIRGKYSRVDTSEGTIVNDIVISAPAREISTMYTQLDTISEAQSIETADNPSLERIATNFGFIRKSSVKAGGKVTFFLNNLPTTDIIIPAGTIVSTLSTTYSAAIQFMVIRQVIMYAALGSFYFNAVTNKYEISTEIEAIEGGIEGVVGANTIVSIIGNISGIDGVYNLFSTAGGEDAETPIQLRSRVANVLSGNTIGTEDSYLIIALADTNIQDAKVVGHGLTSRGVGAVDLYIKGKVVKYQQDSFVSYSQSFSDLILTKQPVLVGGVSSIVSSASGSFSFSDWGLEKDTGAYGGSLYGKDKIVWSTSPSASLGAINISYSYNVLVENLQNVFRKTNKDVLNLNLLVREAIEILIDITCSVKILPGFDQIAVIAQIQTELAVFLDSLLIGEEVQQGDVARIVLNVPGVDDIKIPFTVFRSTDFTVLPDTFGTLNLPSNTYAFTGTVIVEI